MVRTTGLKFGGAVALGAAALMMASPSWAQGAAPDQAPPQCPSGMDEEACQKWRAAHNGRAADRDAPPASGEEKAGKGDRGPHGDRHGGHRGAHADQGPCADPAGNGTPQGCPQGKDPGDRRHGHQGGPHCGANSEDALFAAEQMELPELLVLDQELLSNAQHFSPRPDHAVSPSALKGYIPVFGGRMLVKVGLMANASGMVTSKRIGAPTWFVTSGIPVEGDRYFHSNAQFAMTANTSEVSVDVRARTPAGPLRLVFDTSFAQPDPGFGFHPNYAYAQLGGLLFGFTDSTFVDVDATPFTLDFEGPNALVYEKHAVLRYSFNLAPRATPRLFLSIAIEQPVDDLPAVPGRSNRFYTPDGVLSFRVEGGLGHLQLAGLVRGLGLQSETGRDNLYAVGYGGNLTGSIKLWKGASLVAGISGGTGISAYINDLGGLNDDAVIDADGDLTTLFQMSAYGGLSVHWTRMLGSSLTYGYVDLDSEDYADQLGDRGFRRSHYASINLVCRPIQNIVAGIEGLFGMRETLDGEQGMAYRGQATFQVRY